MADRAKRLPRLHRVRTIQLGLIRADEAAARTKLASEARLSARIAQLAENVAPHPIAGAGLSLAAAAHYRERLQRSALDAANRVSVAEANAARAAQATGAARRDQAAIEKLIERAATDAALAALRALEEAPPARTLRHDPC